MFAVLAMIALVQQSPVFSQATISGVVVTDFRTPEGLVRVYLPDDLAAGDTISGTVYTEPAGDTDADRKENAKVLQGLVVAIDADTAVLSGTRLVIHSMDKSHRLQRSLKVRVASDLREYAAPLQVPDARTDRLPKFLIPELSPSGRPVLVMGPFDGDTSNTRVDFGGKDATVLAETPRSCVVQTDPSFVGPRTMVLNEAGQQSTRTVVLPKLELSAPKTTLARGEKTTLTVKVTGLEGIGASSYPIPIELMNRSPFVVDLPERTNFGIEAKDVRNGEWSRQYTITATGQGGYVITGLLFAIPLHDAKRAMTPEEFNNWLAGLRVLYSDKLKKLQADADIEAGNNNGRVNAGLQANIDRKKKLLTVIDTFSGVSDAGEQGVAAVAIDKLLADEAFFSLAADLISLAADMLGYTEIPMPGIGSLLKGAKAIAKKLPKTLAALEKAEKIYEELEKIKDAKEKVDKAKKLKDALDGAKTTMEGEK